MRLLNYKYSRCLLSGPNRRNTSPRPRPGAAAAPSARGFAGDRSGDPNLKAGKNLDIDYRGHNPTWNITGTVYLPNSSVKFSGAVNKGSNGGPCFGLTVGDLLINGTAEVIANTQCAAAGVTLPTGGHRGVLVN